MLPTAAAAALVIITYFSTQSPLQPVKVLSIHGTSVILTVISGLMALPARVVSD